MPNECSPAKARVVVDLIKALDTTNEKAVSPSTCISNGSRISALLDQVKEQHGSKTMVAILMHAQRELGHTPGPLSSTMVQVLRSHGLAIAGVKRAVDAPPLSS